MVEKSEKVVDLAVGEGDPQLQLLEKYPYLSEREVNALRLYNSFGKQPRIANATVAGWYCLFLAGKSCADIVAANQGFSLGQVVKACVDNEWYALREEHLKKMLATISDKLLQTKLESIQFVSDSIMATHKLIGPKLTKFLQTGDLKDLEGAPVGGLGQYKEYLKLLDGLVRLGQADGKPLPAGMTVNAAAGSEVKIVQATMTKEQILEALSKKLTNG